MNIWSKSIIDAPATELAKFRAAVTRCLLAHLEAKKLILNTGQKSFI